MNTGKTLLTFLAGAAVGAVTALLFAPESGEKTRKKILDGLEDLEEALEEE